MPWFYSPGRGSPILCSPSLFLCWAFHPYGIWTTEAGREVLFNRFYEPIWERLPDGTVRKADGGEWIPWVSQRWLYDDGASQAAAKKTSLQTLVAWGLPEPTLDMTRSYRAERPARV